MRAQVLRGESQPLNLEDLQTPEPKQGEVLIRVASCGVCHTDLHVMRGEVAFPIPCVLGHEISGIVETVGDGVSHVAPGDRVVSAFIMPCGTCRHCVRGHDDICETFFALNRLRGVLYDGTTRLATQDGQPIAMYSMAGLADYAVVPATDVFPLPESLDLSSAAILGCSVFTAVGAVKNVADVRPGDTVAVVAAGGVGLNIIQVAKAFGASTIIAIDVLPEKLELAQKLGATHTVNSLDPDHVEQVRAITYGRGVDIAFEALGNPKTVDTAVKIVDEGGKVVLVGIAPKGVTAEFDITHVVRRKIQILGSFGARTRVDMPLVLKLVAEGKIDISHIITERFSLEDADLAYTKLKEGKIIGRAIVEVANLGV